MTPEDAPETEGKSERSTAAEDIGKQEDKLTSAAQEATEAVTDAAETAVAKAEDAAEEVAEAVLDAAEEAAEKADIPELAGQVADLVISRLRAAGLTVSDVTEEATDAAQEVAEKLEEVAGEAIDAPTEILEDVGDSISPTPGHWWYQWPPKTPRRRNRT